MQGWESAESTQKRGPFFSFSSFPTSSSFSTPTPGMELFSSLEGGRDGREGEKGGEGGREGEEGGRKEREGEEGGREEREGGEGTFQNSSRILPDTEQ